MSEAVDVAETVRGLLKELPDHNTSTRILKKSDEAKRYANAANRILELYESDPDAVKAIIPVSYKSEVPLSESTIILTSPPTAKVAPKQTAAAPTRKRKAPEEAETASTSSSDAPMATVRFIFGGAAQDIEVGSAAEDPVLGMQRCKGKGDDKKEYSGFRFARVLRPPEASHEKRTFEQRDAFVLIHAVAAAPGISSVAPAPSLVHSLLPPSTLPPREPALQPADPFACALREANVDAVRALLLEEPRLAQRYVMKPPHWTPANFEVSALTEAISRSEDHPERALTIVQLLLEKRACVHARDTIGATPLHQAATRGNEKVVRVLLEQPGAEEALWAQTQGNWIPVHNASNMKWEGACRLLVEKMLDIWWHNSDRSKDNATMILSAGSWPKPGRCDTALMDRIINEENDNWGQEFYQDTT